MTPKGVVTHRVRTTGLLAVRWDLVHENLYLSLWVPDMGIGIVIVPNTCTSWLC